MRRRINLRIIVTLILALSIVGLVSYALFSNVHTNGRGPIPSDIISKLDFTPLVVASDAEGYKQKAFTYAPVEGDEKVFSFIITLPTGNTVTASESPQPPQFNEVQDYKAKFLENKSEDTVLTDNGTIYLSHPEKQKEKQIGLMLEKGLIIFFNPAKNLDKTEWRALGNNLTTQRSK